MIELNYLKKKLKDTDIFLDVGANIGMFSFYSANFIKKGKIYAIEADPYNFEKFVKNISLNTIENIFPFNIGVSDKVETLQLHINNRGNRGGNSFLDLEVGRPTVDVECRPLLDIVQENRIERIDGMKIDIEGFEYKVLNKFFKDAPVSLHPNFIITEFHKSLVEKCGGSILDLLKSFGYKILYEDRINFILEK